MKTGLILYIIGDSDEDLNQVIRSGKEKYAADRVEIVSRDAGHPDVNYAWWSLAVKGMHRVICSVVQIETGGSAIFGDSILRLCG